MSMCVYKQNKTKFKQEGKSSVVESLRIDSQQICALSLSSRGLGFVMPEATSKLLPWTPPNLPNSEGFWFLAIQHYRPYFRSGGSAWTMRLSIPGRVSNPCRRWDIHGFPLEGLRQPCSRSIVFRACWYFINCSKMFVGQEYEY